jgi:hypothetical protein
MIRLSRVGTPFAFRQAAEEMGSSMEPVWRIATPDSPFFIDLFFPTEKPVGGFR